MLFGYPLCRGVGVRVGTGSGFGLRSAVRGSGRERRARQCFWARGSGKEGRELRECICALRCAGQWELGD